MTDILMVFAFVFVAAVFGLLLFRFSIRDWYRDMRSALHR